MHDIRSGYLQDAAIHFEPCTRKNDVVPRCLRTALERQGLPVDHSILCFMHSVSVYGPAAHLSRKINVLCWYQYDLGAN